jgi:hypothetical protein
MHATGYGRRSQSVVVRLQFARVKQVAQAHCHSIHGFHCVHGSGHLLLLSTLTIYTCVA